MHRAFLYSFRRNHRKKFEQSFTHGNPISISPRSQYGVIFSAVVFSDRPNRKESHSIANCI
jgi:hypothetical protein